MPKILIDVILARSSVPEPQSAEQLVEVPTVLSPARIALQIAEQIVDTPVPQGRGGKRRVQGFLPEQSSPATSSYLERISERTVEQIVDISPGGGLGTRTGLPHLLVLQMRILLRGFRTFPHGKSAECRAGGAQLGEQVSSSTLSAHQMARAGEPVDSDCSDDVPN